MNPEEIIKKLRDFRGVRFPILSVYLGSAEKSIPYPSYFLSQLHALIHQNLDNSQQKYWKKDIERIEEYLRGSLDRSNKRSLAFFTAQDNLWQVLDFEFFLPPLCFSLHSPYLKPVEEALGTYQKYLVILVDREKARLFTVHLGKIEEHKDFFNGQVPQRVKAKTINLGRTDKIMRHIEYHLNEHLKFITKKTKEFAKGKKIKFILIGGHKEILPKVRKHLPYPLNKKVKGEFICELNIPLNDLLLLSKQKIVTQINKKDQGGV